MNKEPLFHISKRGAVPWYAAWAIRGCAVLLALIVCALITTLVTGENPISVYVTIFNGTFGSPGACGSPSRTWPYCCASPWP